MELFYQENDARELEAIRKELVKELSAYVKRVVNSDFATDAQTNSIAPVTHAISLLII